MPRLVACGRQVLQAVGRPGVLPQTSAVAGEGEEIEDPRPEPYSLPGLREGPHGEHYTGTPAQEGTCQQCVYRIYIIITYTIHIIDIQYT